MPIKKTLYILGAGASREANLPTGNQLKTEIANFLDIKFEDGRAQTSGDRDITEALRIYVKQAEDHNNINPHMRAAWQIRDAMPQAISIDNFIDTHSNNKKIELCGKLAIVRSILNAERNSLLYFDNQSSYSKLDFSVLKETWYASFMKLLTENCTKENLLKRMKSISLIVFNYDRCIEHFLYNSLQNYYGIPPEEARDLINEIEIYHPYGVVGSLPWQAGQSMQFGADPYPKQLLELANQIKTFTEGTDPKSSEILALRNNIAQTDRLVFLGFAFHRLNMNLMSPQGLTPSSEPAACFGTAYDISDSDCEIIKSELRVFSGAKIKNPLINNTLKCVGLFKEYWRSLSLD